MRLAFIWSVACSFLFFSACSCSSKSELAESCGTDETRCKDACVHTESDPDHCGACDRSCDGRDGVEEAACIASTCQIIACEDGLGDCDFDPSTGCETNIWDEAANCGKCGQSCHALPGVEQAHCDKGTCAFECAEGWEDCDEDPLTGCESNPMEDPLNCGTCGVKCDQFCANGECMEAVAVATGLNFSCAATAGGPVYCWGRNHQGQLGDETLTDSLVPVEVKGLSDVREVQASESYACALTQEQEVWCWGWGSNGRLGIGEGTSRSTIPVHLSTLDKKVLQIALAPGHACALVEGGSVYCWGNNSRNQVSGSYGSHQYFPVVVPGITGASRIATGRDMSCALKGGEVFCWGFSSPHGQLGNADLNGRKIPTLVTGFSGVSAIAAGGYHTCFVVDGEVFCAGHGKYGQMGNGTYNEKQTTHHKVQGLSQVVEVALGKNHSCALTSEKEVWCWGQNSAGQVGDNTLADQALPQRVGLSPVIALATASWDSTCAVTEQDGVWCWGLNDYGQLGNQDSGASSNSPVPVQVQWQPAAGP